MLAEREGFEPPVRLRALRISSAARSTTLPPLRDAPQAHPPRASIGAAINMADAHVQGWRRSCKTGAAPGGDAGRRRVASCPAKTSAELAAASIRDPPRPVLAP